MVAKLSTTIEKIKNLPNSSNKGGREIHMEVCYIFDNFINQLTKRHKIV
jgi:hypothetical protein